MANRSPSLAVVLASLVIVACSGADWKSLGTWQVAMDQAVWNDFRAEIESVGARNDMHAQDLSFPYSRGTAKALGLFRSDDDLVLEVTEIVTKPSNAPANAIYLNIVLWCTGDCGPADMVIAGVKDVLDSFETRLLPAPWPEGN